MSGGMFPFLRALSFAQSVISNVISGVAMVSAGRIAIHVAPFHMHSLIDL